MLDNVYKVKNVNALVFFTMCACFFTMLDNATGGGIFKVVALMMDVFVIIWCLVKTNSKYFFSHISPLCIFIIIILIINFILSPYNPRYSLLLKFFGYLTFFIYARNKSENGYVLRCNKYLLYTMIVIPLLVVLFLDNSPEKSTFFPNSNMFTFWGISMALAYLLLNQQNKRNVKIAWIIVLSYVFIGTSLGILLAIIMSTYILNYKKINPILLVSSALILLLCIAYVDIPVFERLRDSFMIFKQLSWSDFLNPSDVNFYELQMAHSSSGRMDNASFLWRIMQWTILLIGYLSNLLMIPFGQGADWSIAFTGKPPHNDYVLILVEYGLVVFVIVMCSVKRILRKIMKVNVVYFLLPIFIYHITENLLDTFPQNVFFYLSLGYYYSYQPNRNESIID